MMLLRHQLVYLPDKTPFTLIPSPNSPENVTQAVSDWLAKGWPCVMANQYDMAQTSIRLGIPLYQAGSIYRIHLLVDATAIAKTEVLPALNQVIKQLADDEDESIGIYGSFMWQHVTQQPYVHDRSDLDILMSNDNISLTKLKEKVMELQQKLKRNIDGEVRFNKLGDISIKELCQDSPSLLVKSTTKVEFIERRQVYEYYPNLCR